ncbi:hypothetical protein ACS7SF_22295 (plasmid) [Ralstonia sp. 25C]|uniref:hypothetical protein n=1 Tax=Ralstonia sp. 25C TaxID=3447363 RepID=UPI003F74DA48
MINSSAFACKPGEYFNAKFSGENDYLSGLEAGKLGAWSAELKKYPKHELFVLVGYTDEAAPNEALAKRRAQWVRDFLIGTGEEKKRVVYGGAEIFKPEKIGKYSDITASTIAIDFVPGCPNRCCIDPSKETSGAEDK